MTKRRKRLAGVFRRLRVAALRRAQSLSFPIGKRAVSTLRLRAVGGSNADVLGLLPSKQTSVLGVSSGWRWSRLAVVAALVTSVCRGHGLWS